MCPLCISTAVLIAGGAATAARLAQAAMKKSGDKHTVEADSTPAQSEVVRTDQEREWCGEIRNAFGMPDVPGATGVPRQHGEISPDRVKKRVPGGVHRQGTGRQDAYVTES